MAVQEKVIGIDLGTTNSVVSVMEGGEVKVIANQEGNRLTPSIVAFTDKGDRLVGDPAKRQAVTNPKNTIYSVKRFMGRRHSEVESEEKLVPYKVVGGPSEYVRVEAGGKEYTPPEVSALVLRKLKEAAEAYLGHTVTRAVITVPAYFNDAQRQATKDAGEIAGLKVERIINEPTAAALAYGLQTKKDEKIAVFDLGGGTFDISVLEVSGDLVEVLSTNGDTHLGGDDFDQALLDFIADKFKAENGIDLRKDPMALQRLREAAEKAKKELSSSQTTDINLPFITADASGAKHLQLNVTRAEFEKLIDHLIDRCKKPVEQALKDAKLKPSDIDEVVLVGGSTRVPKVQEFVKSYFNKEPNRSVNPDEVVSIGASIQGGIIAGDVKDMLLLDVTPLSLGIETEGGIMTSLVERNTTIPTSKKQVFSTAADGQTAVTVSVFQGERPMARDNRLLSQFNLDGIPPAPRGVPQVEVSFDIDVNGIVSVKAKDLGSGKEQSVKIQNASGLDPAEIERMKRDAESHAGDDKKRRELAEARNKASTSAYEVEKLLKEHGEKLDAGSKSAIEAAIARVKQVETGEDVTAINTAVEALQQASYAMAQHINAPGGATGAAADDGAASKGGDDVIDAEFEKKS
ncbi:molecular chaperone DnaK [Planctopirus hydrillae]|uniref:Chaperone protein DnaK n=1 Tax=Planctopirus hydrillae TaxID=1841610 RepID=A0A1C3E4H7_9PLAN|nr:molecular chaperone DnaK [Planctopirus hydrillae]ODA28130.1 molecular chaperone DnaK [Planctopirus hydrillae]